MCIEQTRKDRIAVASFIRQCEQFDDRYISRLSDSDREAIRSASEGLRAGRDPAKDDWFWNGNECVNQFSGKAPKFSIEPAKKRLAQLEEEIHAWDTFQTLASLPAFQTAKDAYVKSLQILGEESKAAGISLNRFYAYTK